MVIKMPSSFGRRVGYGAFTLIYDFKMAYKRSLFVNFKFIKLVF
jgi:hypothetical protein